MLSLKDIKHEKFYIDCVDNATLRKCVKLLPYDKNWVQTSGRYNDGINPANTIIAVEDNKEYFTISSTTYVGDRIYKYSDISDFTLTNSNWYDTVHVMD
jgi:hypothetical protein